MTENRHFRARILLIWLLLELLAATQVRTAQGAPLLWEWVHAVADPIRDASQWLGEVGSDLAVGLRDMSRMLAEHQRLRTEMEELEARNLLLEEDQAALGEAASLLGGVTAYERSAVLGRCVFRNLGLGQMEVRIESAAVIRPDTPVISGRGLVGRVVRCSGSSCWLQLITHPAAAVAVRNTTGTLQGLAAGSGGSQLDVEYVPHSAALLVGERLLTSGADGIYPPGIPVADVTRIRETDASFLEVAAAPLVDLANMRVVLLLPEWSRQRRGAPAQ